MSGREQRRGDLGSFNAAEILAAGSYRGQTF